MRNPILQQLAPDMSESDIKFLLKRLRPRVDELTKNLEVIRDSITICEQELNRRGAHILLRSTRPDND